MDWTKVILLIGKGLTVIEALVAAAEDASPAIKALIQLVNGAKGGAVTTAQLVEVEALLDQMVEDFNLEMD